ncbi:MAG: FeoA family protein [Polyangiaceae bacterium]
MTANSTPFADAETASDASREKDGVSSLSLASISIGEEAVVAELALEPELAAWLRAVGIGEGDNVSVLRSGAFGGPLHVRNAVGGEFALNRQLAKSILVKRV